MGTIVLFPREGFLMNTFKLGDEVIITGGFYKGVEGVVVKKMGMFYFFDEYCIENDDWCGLWVSWRHLKNKSIPKKNHLKVIK